MHKLLEKKGMDTVNEQLLDYHAYPAADQDYDHPDWYKGTEPEEIKTGSLCPCAECTWRRNREASRTKRGSQFRGSSPRTAGTKTDDPRYLKITIDRLKQVATEVVKHWDEVENFDCDWESVSDALAYLKLMQAGPTKADANRGKPTSEPWNSYESLATPEDKAYLREMRIKGALRVLASATLPTHMREVHYLRGTIRKLERIVKELHRHPEDATKFSCDWNAVKDAILYLIQISPMTDAVIKDKDFLRELHSERSQDRPGPQKRSVLDMHNEPKDLPPRTDQRSYLDEEVKEELKPDKEVYHRLNSTHFGARLLDAK